ncbi:MAG TPA: hypothetical protein DHV59_12755 [Oxalobacteraceae bacterium]|nr:hypothetical protein [Oxalobacteraceae bacterium]
MKLVRLSPQDFSRLAEQTKLGEAARAMARAVLVDGRTQTEVASDYGMTKQRVGLAVGAIHRVYEQSDGKSMAWVSVALDLPDFLSHQLADLMESLKTCEDEKKRQKALSVVSHSIASAKLSLE